MVGWWQRTGGEVRGAMAAQREAAAVKRQERDNGGQGGAASCSRGGMAVACRSRGMEAGERKRA